MRDETRDALLIAVAEWIEQQPRDERKWGIEARRVIVADALRQARREMRGEPENG